MWSGSPRGYTTEASELVAEQNRRKLQEQYRDKCKTWPWFVCKSCGYKGDLNELECACGDMTVETTCPKCGSSATMWLTQEEYEKLGSDSL